jgi:hypothetical protein
MARRAAQRFDGPASRGSTRAARRAPSRSGSGSGSGRRRSLCSFPPCGRGFAWVVLCGCSCRSAYGPQRADNVTEEDQHRAAHGDVPVHRVRLCIPTRAACAGTTARGPGQTSASRSATRTARPTRRSPRLVPLPARASVPLPSPWQSLPIADVQLSAPTAHARWRTGLSLGVGGCHRAEGGRERGRYTLGKARQGKARQGKARQGKARQGKARQGKARQGKATNEWAGGRK